jgi:hypothetical protein
MRAAIVATARVISVTHAPQRRGSSRARHRSVGDKALCEVCSKASDEVGGDAVATIVCVILSSALLGEREQPPAVDVIDSVAVGLVQLSDDPALAVLMVGSDGSWARRTRQAPSVRRPQRQRRSSTLTSSPLRVTAPMNRPIRNDVRLRMQICSSRAPR